jgi:hypothetical protein
MISGPGERGHAWSYKSRMSPLQIRGVLYTPEAWELMKSGATSGE